MFCSKCGAEILESDMFCPKCGQAVTPVCDVEVVTPEAYVQSAAEAPKAPAVKDNSLKTMIFGIVSLACSCTFWPCIAGIVFGYMAKAQAKQYKNVNGELTGKAKAGYKMGKAGLILGWIFAVLLPFAIVGLIVSELEIFELLDIL